MKSPSSVSGVPTILLAILTQAFFPLMAEEAPSGGYAEAEAFLKQHTDLVVLEKGDAAVAVAPAWQGRVMTITFDRKAGPSFGWINRPVIEKGFPTDEEKVGKLEAHFYIFGGGHPHGLLRDRQPHHQPGR